MDPILRISEALNGSTGTYLDSAGMLGQWQTRLHQVELLDSPHYGRVLRLDGRSVVSEREEFIVNENLVHPALAAHTAPRRVLVAGGADGGALEEVLKHPTVEHVTLCEPDTELVRLAREHLFAVHRGALDHAKLRLLAGEGARFLRDTQERFDLLVVGAQDEAHRSVDFLQHCRAALMPGGALVMHLGAPVARPERVAEQAQRMNGIFRIVRPYTMYVPLYGTQWAMAVCSDKLDPKSLTADEIDRRIEHRKLQDLKFYNGETHEGVFALPNFVRDLVNPPRLKLQTRGRRLGVVHAAAK